jgi:riboflavin biosynthesis pyrimidine reductase
MAMSIDGFGSDLDGRNMDVRRRSRGEGLGRRIYLERQPALHEQPQLPGHGQPAEPQPGAGSWAEAYVTSGDLAEEITTLKAQEGKPIIAHGGVSFARSLVAQGLVDQFALIVAPVALGEGLPLFSELGAPTPLKMMSSKAFPGGAVAHVYRAA